MIEIGDKVYYRYCIGMFYRTLRGTVIAIKDGIATVNVNTQNSGGTKDVHVNLLTKNKKQ